MPLRNRPRISYRKAISMHDVSAVKKFDNDKTGSLKSYNESLSLRDKIRLITNRFRQFSSKYKTVDSKFTQSLEDSTVFQR